MSLKTTQDTIEKCDALVVDDEDSFQFTLREVLKAEGFVTHGCENGQTALEYLHSHPTPSLIILDLMMPILDGFGFIQEKLKDPKISKIPVILLTAGRASIDPVPPAAIYGFLRKPFKLDIFLAMVHGAIETQETIKKSG